MKIDRAMAIAVLALIGWGMACATFLISQGKTMEVRSIVVSLGPIVGNVILLLATKPGLRKIGKDVSEIKEDSGHPVPPGKTASK